MEKSFSDTIKGFRVIYTALLVGITIFVFVAFINVYFLEMADTPGSPYSNILLIVINIMAVIAILAGNMVFRKKLAMVEEFDIPQRLILFRIAMIMRAACYEGPAFLFIVGYMLTGILYFLAEAVVVLFLMILLFPTNQRIADSIKADLS
jgi:hypothetical protein